MKSKKDQIYDELQNHFNVSLIDPDFLNVLINFLVKNYSKKKHNSLKEFIDLTFHSKELTSEDIIQRLLIENQELKANLDGISLSHHEDTKNNIFYASAINPYAIEVLKPHRNQKGKEWRSDLYEIAQREYEQNKSLKMTEALESAFDKLPNKNIYKDEFLEFRDSIYRKFTKLLKL